MKRTNHIFIMILAQTSGCSGRQPLDLKHEGHLVSVALNVLGNALELGGLRRSVHPAASRRRVRHDGVRAAARPRSPRRRPRPTTLPSGVYAAPVRRDPG